MQYVKGLDRQVKCKVVLLSLQNDELIRQLAAIFSHCFGTAPSPPAPAARDTPSAQLGKNMTYHAHADKYTHTHTHPHVHACTHTHTQTPQLPDKIMEVSDTDMYDRWRASLALIRL